MSVDEALRLHLKWVQRAGRAVPDPTLAFKLPSQTSGEVVEYMATFRVCQDPRCPCHNLCAYCVEVLPDLSGLGPTRNFWLDVRERKVAVTPDLEADPEARRLSEVVSAGLDEPAWEQLRDWLWKAKIVQIETADVSKIDLSDLPDATGGLMVPFSEVFPLGLNLNFEFQGGFWAADEQFCVRPGCRCTGTILSFLQLKDSTGRSATSLRSLPALRYDYRSHSTEEMDRGLPGTPPLSSLFRALKETFPALDQKLEAHHRILQALYARHFSVAYDVPQPGSGAAVPIRSKSVGRNAPCPCGSGKKYKKCCGG